MILQEKINRDYQLILGSGSPRRKVLLENMGFEFDVAIQEVEENVDFSLPAGEIVMALAQQKSQGIELKNENQILRTADTIVYNDNMVLGKPKNLQEAKEMLFSLSDKSHQVYSGICLRSPKKELSDYVCTEVYFNKLDEDEVDYYLRTYSPLDKAGAYGIQEWIGFHSISSINGSYYNVMGLPCAKLSEMLKKFILE